MKPEISIIVPVYNVQQYLEKCIESILAQTFTNFELILVNDGSTDNSGIICDKYKSLDERIEVIHKVNGGLSSARNAGIDIAVGNYIGFVDSDDYILSDMYELLYENIKKQNADMSICGVIRENQYNRKSWVEPLKNKESMDKNEALLLTLQGKYMNISACNKLYKKEIFDELKFKEGKVFEDFYITPEIFNKCKTIAYTSKEKYIYVCREDSIMSKSSIKPNMDIIDCANHVLQIISESNKEILIDSTWGCIKRVWKWIGIIYYNDAEDENIEFIKLSRKLIKNNIINIITSRKISVSEGVGIISFCYFPHICKYLYKLKRSN